MERGDNELRLRGALAESDGLVWAYLFGSAVRGGTFRDLDVAVMPAGGAFGKLTDLGRLEVRLAVASGCEVDLVDLRSAPLMLLGSILRGRRVLLDRDPEARHVWEAEAMIQILDFEPAIARYSALRRERLLERLARGEAGRARSPGRAGAG